MTVEVAHAAGVPRRVSLFSPVLQSLLSMGVPLGPNALITIRGRTSGLPRTTPVAVIEVDGRRWIWAPWGEVHWVRNLRAAGRATLTVRRRKEEVTATELNEAERLEYFRDIMGPFTRSMRFGVQFVRAVDGVDVDDPVDAAARCRVFELHAI